MGRKLKFDTKSKILSVRVPLERYDEIKAIVYDLVENRIQNVNRIQNQEIDTELIDKLVLLMIKAEINSDNFGVNIKMEEIESNIKRLRERGLI